MKDNLKRALTYALALASPIYFGCATFQNNQSKVLASSDHAKVIDQDGDNIGDILKIRYIDDKTDELKMQIQSDNKSLENALTFGELMYTASLPGDIVESVFDEIGKEVIREYERVIEKESEKHPHDFRLKLEKDKKEIINKIVQGD